MSAPALDGIPVWVTAHRVALVETTRFGDHEGDATPGVKFIEITNPRNGSLEIEWWGSDDAPPVGTKLMFKLTEVDSPRLEAS